MKYVIICLFLTALCIFCVYAKDMRSKKRREQYIARYGEPPRGMKEIDPNGQKKVYATVFIVLAIAFGIYSYALNKQAVTMEDRCTEIVSGNVISTEYHHARYGSSTYVKYTYTIGNIEYVKTDKYGNGDVSVSRGGAYPVHYNPDDPTVSYIGDDPPKDKTSKWAMICAGVFALLSIVAIFMCRRNKPDLRKDDSPNE